MDLQPKLEILADAAKYDASCASSGAKRPGGKGIGHNTGIGICHSYTPDGRCVSLLKILLTNFCIFDCQYCINRVSSDVRRARFTVDEVVQLTLEFYKRNYIEGLFLSSGIIQSTDYTMEQIIAVARNLRAKGFGGYIHLKVTPSASKALIAEAGLWADRLSLNIELPTQTDLDALAPGKKRADLEEGMGGIAERITEAKEERSRHAKAPTFAPAGQSTQVIVGATSAPDAVILDGSQSLYKRFGLRRVYYSAYSPIPHGAVRLPVKPPPLVREHRLYQADWLMRYYGFKAEELTTPQQPDLPLDMDPKLAWALRHREQFPVDVNRADLEMLLRIPGMGLRNARKIIQIRRHHALRLDDLKTLRVPLSRARPFVLTADFNPAVLRVDSPELAAQVAPGSQQLMLFDAAESALTGEL